MAKKLILILLALILMAVPAFALYTNHQSCNDPPSEYNQMWCPQQLDSYTIDPCISEKPIALNGYVEIAMNGSACDILFNKDRTFFGDNPYQLQANCAEYLGFFNSGEFLALSPSIFLALHGGNETWVDNFYRCNAYSAGKAWAASDVFCANVSIGVWIYYGTANQQFAGWHNISSWGYTEEGYVGNIMVSSNDFPTGFDTAGDGFQMKIAVKNAENSTYMPWAEKIIIYDVTAIDNNQSYGIFGSCQTTATTPVTISGGITSEPNTLKTFFESFGDWTATFLYMLLMVAVAGAMFWVVGISRDGQSWKVATGLTLVVEVLMALVGVWIGALSWVWLFLFFLGVFAYIAIKIRDNLM